MDLWKIFRHITVEPIVFIRYVGLGIGGLAVMELYLHKVCSNTFNFGPEVCSDLPGHRDEQILVQKEVSTLKALNDALQTVPPIITTIFASSWSDLNGRRLFMALPLLGNIMDAVLYAALAHWWDTFDLRFVLFNAFFTFCGEEMCFSTMVFAFVADMTDKKERTRRMAFTAALIPIGAAIGKLLGAVIKAQLGLVYNFVIPILLYILSICYITFLLKERVHSEASVPNSHSSRLTLVKANFKGVFGTLAKKRPGNKRLFLCILLICFFLDAFGDWSKVGNLYWYLSHQLRLSFNDYTWYLVATQVTAIPAQFALIPILSNFLGWPDTAILIMTTLGCLFHGLTLALATKVWMLYAGVVFAVMEYPLSSVMDSLLTKIVGETEHGKVLALTRIVKSLIPLFAAPLFGFIYRSTVESVPNACLLIDNIMIVLSLLLIVFVHVQMKKHHESDKNFAQDKKATEEEQQRIAIEKQEEGC